MVASYSTHFTSLHSLDDIRLYVCKSEIVRFSTWLVYNLSAIYDHVDEFYTKHAESGLESFVVCPSYSE